MSQALVGPVLFAPMMSKDCPTPTNRQSVLHAETVDRNPAGRLCLNVPESGQPFSSAQTTALRDPSHSDKVRAWHLDFISIRCLPSATKSSSPCAKTRRRLREIVDLRDEAQRSAFVA